MNKYSLGKIYKIVDNTNNNVYIGSTIQTLPQRLGTHRHRKTCKSRLIINNGDYNIILIENYPCESKEQLELRERYFIKNNECINKIIPGRSRKEYNEDNKEYISKQKKEYREKNKEYVLKYEKNYRENNKEKIKEKREYTNSMGGDPRSNNNLLLIDPNLFF